MSDTIAVTLDQLAAANNDYGPSKGQPLCPVCNGRLHPYRVSFLLSQIPGQGPNGVDRLDGWVAVCQGTAGYNRRARESDPEYDAEDFPPCGFSMPMTPHAHLGR